MVGHGGSSASLYLADPTSPIPSHCAPIVVTSTLRVNLVFLSSAASMRLCMGSRRGFIIRMKVGNSLPCGADPMSASHTVRIRQRNTLGPASDGHQYSVVHVTGYIKNWPPAGTVYTTFIHTPYFISRILQDLATHMYSTQRTTLRLCFFTAAQIA